MVVGSSPTGGNNLAHAPSSGRLAERFKASRLSRDLLVDGGSNPPATKIPAYAGLYSSSIVYWPGRMVFTHESGVRFPVEEFFFIVRYFLVVTFFGCETQIVSKDLRSRKLSGGNPSLHRMVCYLNSVAIFGMKRCVSFAIENVS